MHAVSTRNNKVLASALTMHAERSTDMPFVHIGAFVRIHLFSESDRWLFLWALRPHPLYHVLHELWEHCCGTVIVTSFPCPKELMVYMQLPLSLHVT